MATKKQAVENWNLKNPPGKSVVVKKDNGDEFTTHSRSKAWMLGGHTPVVQVDGIAGAYLLDRVRAL